MLYRTFELQRQWAPEDMGNYGFPSSVTVPRKTWASRWTTRRLSSTAGRPPSTWEAKVSAAEPE
eukprot:2563548-Prorocentrum_lima.AAC.1